MDSPHEGSVMRKMVTVALCGKQFVTHFLFPYNLSYHYLSFLSAGFILLTVWAWVIMCSPDILSWNFMFTIINSIQVAMILYRLKPIKFHPDIEALYAKLFQPLNVPRWVMWRHRVITGLLWRDSTGHRWPHKRASDAEMLCFLVVSQNKLLNKQAICRYHKTLWCSCDVTVMPTASLFYKKRCQPSSCLYGMCLRQRILAA